MKLKKRIAAIGAASVMAVSMMSFGASASKLYTTQTATRTNVEYTYPPHYEKDLVYKYYETKRVIGKLYSRAYAGGFWRWSTDARAGANAVTESADPYASIVINGKTKSVSENAGKGRYKNIREWTDWKETATSSTNHSVVFKIHCWY